jgi:hypothetical protein
MALLYLSVGIFLGGLSAVAAMAMLFVAKQADEAEGELVAHMGSATPHKGTF